MMAAGLYAVGTLFMICALRTGWVKPFVIYSLLTSLCYGVAFYLVTAG